ncbi:hypothetical protein AB0B45_44115 [Nonomuraea sp. NPDC049152]|uniref:hypothetical protein n=1 Tax=Nonomuraea sp. NPDC049152 TaxID=3154350 RepID=UPI0033F16E91
MALFVNAQSRTCLRHHPRHDRSCGPTCAKPGHNCDKRPCLKGCTGHADKCPKRSGGGIVFRPRKGKSKLTLQYHPALLDQLKAHKKIQVAERLKAGERWTDHDLIFTTRFGGPIERTQDWKAWKSILRQAGVRDANHMSCQDPSREPRSSSYRAARPALSRVRV